MAGLVAARAQLLRKLRGDPSAEQQRIAAALGLDARPGGRDEVAAQSDRQEQEQQRKLVRAPPTRLELAAAVRCSAWG
jgi:hypothetical protein